VEPGRYMESDVFNRIRLTIRKEPQTLERFKEEFCAEFTDENCLVVLNTKKAAVAMYRHVKENMPGYTVYVLTTNLIPRDRKERIERVKDALKKGEKIIVISTQLVEAGVDFSFKNVYRDFGPLDSIIQVAGRCNRNGEFGELGGRMTLVRLMNEDHRDKEFHTYIYEHIITQYVDETLTGGQYESREFSTLSEDYFNRFDFRKESKKLLDAICDLNYDRETGEQTPVSQFKLIKEYDEESVYILTAEEAQEDMESLIEKKSMLEEGEMAEEETDRVMLEIERIKSRLREYGLSLRTGDLEEYRGKGIVEEVGAYRYISFKIQEEYVYDKEIGFLKEPKKEISGALCF
jgi:CRISPR-associated endonuclease/helicase Cas3